MQNTSGTIEELNISNDQLDLVLNKHPYFQLGLIEKSKRLRRENHIDALKTLRKCAILIPERSLLYSQLHESEGENEISVEDTSTEVKEVVSQAGEESIKEDTLITEEINVVEDKESEVSSKEDKDTINEIDNLYSGLLEKDYLVEAVNQSIQVDALHYDVENVIEPIADPIEQKPVRKESVLSFTEWLDGEVSLEDTVIQNDLIDKFIQESPQIQRLNDQSFYSATEKAKESISDELLEYSETLATIYAQQGNKTLAIKAYKYLMLKNPQKSVYFADLIKKLEE